MTIATARRKLRQLTRGIDLLLEQAAEVRKRGLVPFLHDRQLLELRPGEVPPDGALELLPV